GLFLRSLLKDPFIYVLSGLLPGTESLFVEHSLTPVLNDFGMIHSWADEAKKWGQKLPCVLHVDTGMHRNGLDSTDVVKLFDSLDVLDSLDVKMVMSHLVSSHDSQNP